MFGQAYYTFTEEEKYRYYKYFSPTAKSDERKYTKDGHYYMGGPIPYFLSTTLKSRIKTEGCEIKGPWSEGLKCFIKKSLLSCKQREKTEIVDQRASIVDISQVHKEIIDEFYDFIAQQLDNLQRYFPDIPRENFILLLIPMIIPSKRGPQATAKEYLQRRFSEKIRNVDRLWQDYSSFTSDLEEKILNQAEEKFENYCHKLPLIFINRLLVDKELPSPIDLHLVITRESMESAVRNFEALHVREKKDLLFKLSEFTTKLIAFICNKRGEVSKWILPRHEFNIHAYHKYNLPPDSEDT